MRRFLFLIPFILINSPLTPQNEENRKIYLSSNVASGLISGEANLYLDYKLSENSCLQLSYGHRFYSFNLIKNGGSGSGIKYLPQQADVIRIGIKRYLKIENSNLQRTKYLIYRLSYWNLHTPKYTNRSGSNGLNSSHREIVSVDKNVGNFAFGIGKEVSSNKQLFIDLFLCIGISIGEKNTHRYSYTSYAGQIELPSNTFERSTSIFPTVELGCKIGIGW